MVLGPYKTSELKRWVRKLRYFRICGSFGAHFDEPDSLRVALELDGGVEQVLSEFARSGADVVPHDADPHSSSRLVRVGGQIVYMSGAAERLTSIHFIGPELIGWVPISSAQVDAAAAWEQWIDPIADKLVDPPYFPELCVTPATRPDLWR